MTTLKDLTQDLMDYLLTIDKKKLSMMDLNTYCGMLKTVKELKTPTFEETMEKHSKCFSSFGYLPAPVKLKGDEEDG